MADERVEAVELDGVPVRVVRGKGRELQVAPTRRKLFDKERKREFLEWFAGTANVSLSAEKAGVHYRTVLRHRATKPGFAADFDTALAQGKVRLRAWLIEARDDGGTDYDPTAHAPANLTPESALQLLRDDAQREAAATRAAAAGGGGAGGGATGRGGRPLKVVDMEEVRRQTVKRLRALGIRLAIEAAGEGEAPL